MTNLKRSMLFEKVVVLVSEPWLNKFICTSFQNHPCKVQMCLAKSNLFPLVQQCLNVRVIHLLYYTRCQTEI